MSVLGVVVITAALFVAAILNLALSSRFRNRAMGLSAFVAIVIGLVFYSYGYTRVEGFSAVAILRTLLTVCRMFGGVNDSGVLSGTPLFQSVVWVSLFWMGHFLAFYVTASAAIEVLGKRLLKYLRVRMLRRGPLTIVYGASADTAPLVRQGGSRRALVFVADQADAAASALADAMGGVLFSGGAAACATPEFLKRFGVGGRSRSIDFYCLHDDQARNLRFAEAMRGALNARQVAPDVTSAFLLGVSEEKAAHLQAWDGRYGFGALMASETYALMARTLIEELPPWTLLAFDDLGRARGDFRVCIAGFGQMGRAAFHQIFINGQMEGSTFHADIFEPRTEAAKGYFEARCPELITHYDIALHPAEAGSDAFYRRLAECPPSVILLCTGSTRLNAELASDIERLYGAKPGRPPIVQCAGDALRIGDAEYRLGGVDVRKIDQRAMIINHRYCGGPSPEADWRGCDPFSRASSRASADFCPAFLRAAGMEREAALSQWPPRPEVLENLARTEHLRWCAFHLAMGYRPMGDAEFDARAERCRRGEDVRVSKNAEARTHACLIPWEKLDALSERENAVTGGSVDYKRMDVNNVLALPEIMKLEAAKPKC